MTAPSPFPSPTPTHAGAFRFPSILAFLRRQASLVSFAISKNPGSPAGGSRPQICLNLRNLRFPIPAVLRRQTPLVSFVIPKVPGSPAGGSRPLIGSHPRKRRFPILAVQPETVGHQTSKAPSLPTSVGAARCARRGQAMVELVVGIICLLILVLGATTLAQLTHRQIRLRHDVRAEAGRDALTRSTEGWVNDVQAPETRSHPLHRVNAHTRLETFSPALPSRLPSSNYTLAARDLPDAELGLDTVTREERVPLDQGFVDLIYGKDSALLRESVTFPAATGLWE